MHPTHHPTTAPIILVDMDDTIADFTGEVLRRWAARHPSAFTLPFERVTEFEVDELFPVHDRAAVRAIYREEGFCSSLQPLPGAIEALQAMVASGIDVRILTAPLSTPTCAQEKWGWTAQHLGETFTRRLIIAKDKTFVRGDLLIDDKPVITGLLTPTWQHVFFDRPFNRNLPGPRLSDWAAWQTLLASRRA